MSRTRSTTSSPPTRSRNTKQHDWWCRGSQQQAVSSTSCCSKAKRPHMHARTHACTHTNTHNHTIKFPSKCTTLLKKFRLQCFHTHLSLYKTHKRCQIHNLSVTRCPSHTESQVLCRLAVRRTVHTPGLTHLEYDSSAVHPGGDCGLLVGVGLVSSNARLTKAAQ